MESLKKFDDVEIDIDKPKEMVQEVKKLVSKVRYGWENVEHLKERIFSDGITNVLVGVYHQDDPNKIIMVRLYGHNTDEIIDRKAEVENMITFMKHGLGPELFASFKNGLVYEFMPGVIPTPEMIFKKEINQPVVEMMAKMHRMKLGGEPCMWSRCRKFLEVGPGENGFKDPIKAANYIKYGIMTKAQLAAEIDEMEALLKDSGSPIVFCHNDLLLGNIVYNESNDKRSVTFIDYEYGDQNYQALDIGNHFCEFVGISGDIDYEKYYPKKDFQLDWIKRYLTAFNDGKVPNNEEVNQTYVLVNKFALVSHLIWGIWALVQAKNSNLDFDFLDYARIRLNEYINKKPVFLALN